MGATNRLSVLPLGLAFGHHSPEPLFGVLGGHELVEVHVIRVPQRLLGGLQIQRTRDRAPSRLDDGCAELLKALDQCLGLRRQTIVRTDARDKAGRERLCGGETATSNRIVKKRGTLLYLQGSACQPHPPHGVVISRE